MNPNQTVERLMEHLREKIIARQRDHHVELIFPIESYSEEPVVVHIEEENHTKVRITDGGLVFAFLDMIDPALRSDNADLFTRLQNLYGFSIEKSKIVFETAEFDPQLILQQICTQLSIHNLRYMIEPESERAKAFLADFYAFNDQHRITYEKHYPLSLSGKKRSIKYSIDAVIEKRILLQSIGTYGVNSYYTNLSGKSKMIPFMELRHQSTIQSWETAAMIYKKEQLSDDTLDLVERYTDHQFYWNNQTHYLKAFVASGIV